MYYNVRGKQKGTFTLLCTVVPLFKQAKPNIFCAQGAIRHTTCETDANIFPVIMKQQQNWVRCPREIPCLMDVMHWVV